MSTTWKKCQRTTEQASPRGTRKCRIQELFRPGSPTSSSDRDYPSPPRRRHGFRKLVGKMVHPRSSSIVPDDTEYMPDPETKDYRGVRYRVELNKYVTEIRPAKSTKKIWLGTYDTAEEAARAFDIGNLCCKKNLPLNFQDSPRMLRKISSGLSPDERRNAIAKMAKEVARMVINVSSDGEAVKRKEVDHAAAKKAHELIQQKARDQDPEPESEPEQVPVRINSKPRAQLLEASGIGSSAITYTENIPENVVAVIEEDLVATSMPLSAGGEGGSGGHSWSFDYQVMFFHDDHDLPLHKLINFRPEPKFGDVLCHYHS